jgi:hypothetical protein
MELAVPLSTVLVLAVMSLAAMLVLPAKVSLPMQWGVGGKPTWFAPRIVAVSFTPVLACLVFAAMLAPALLSNGAALEPALSASVTFVAGVFVVVHVVHLWLAIRHVR